MSDYKPPFHMTDKMTFLIAEYCAAGRNHQSTFAA